MARVIPTETTVIIATFSSSQPRHSVGARSTSVYCRCGNVLSVQLVFSKIKSKRSNWTFTEGVHASEFNLSHDHPVRTYTERD